MSEALSRAGKRNQLIIQKGGDHQLSSEKHRMEFLDALGSFLDRELK